MLLAAIAALFVATACSDSDEEKGPDGPGPDEKPLTFQIAVSDIKDGQAKLEVVPSDQMATYYWSAVKKSIYDGLGSDEAFLEDEMAFIQKEATKNQMTLSAYLQWVTGRGTSTYTLTGLESKTEYYAYVYGIKTDGTLVTGVTKELFTSGENGGGDDDGNGPEFTLTYTAGDPEGNNTNTAVTALIKGTGVTSGKAIMGKTTDINEVLATGKTYTDIVTEQGQTFAANHIDLVNGEGLAFYNDACTPGTEYTVIALMANADGQTVKHASCTTTGTQGDGPEVDITMLQGYTTDGTTYINKDTYMSVAASLSGSKAVASAKYFFAATSDVEGLLAKGYSYEDMGDAGNDYEASQIEELNTDKATEFYFNNLTPETSFTCICKFVGEDGNSTYVRKEMSTAATGGSTEDGPNLTITIKAGDKTGANTDTQMTVGFKVTGTPAAASGKYLMAPTASFTQAGGVSADLVTNAGTAFSAEEITMLNDAGISGVFGSAAKPLLANTEYTLACLVADAEGNTTLKSVVASTTGGGSTEPTDAYKAWLGTWTVTSETSEVTKAPISFEVTISQKVVNRSYDVAGWTITRDLADIPTTGNLLGDGSLALPNQTQILTLDNGNIVYFICRYYDFGPDYLAYMLCQGNFNALVATQDASGAGTVTGGTINFDGDPNDYFASSMDFFSRNPTTGGWAGYSETGDYPVAPYSMTKKSNAVAPVRRMMSVAMADQTTMKQENVRVEVGSMSSVLNGLAMNNVALGLSHGGRMCLITDFTQVDLVKEAAVKIEEFDVCSKVRSVRNN